MKHFYERYYQANPKLLQSVWLFQEESFHIIQLFYYICLIARLNKQNAQKL